MRGKIYPRNSEGLTDAIFDALELLRDGAMTHQEASAYAQLANAELQNVAMAQRAQSQSLEHDRRAIGGHRDD